MSDGLLNWDDPALAVKSDDSRTARYRRLQSWYRQTELGVPYAMVGKGAKAQPVGSRIDQAAVDKDPGVNFLHPRTAEYAARRADVVVSQGGTLDRVRLQGNLLSSMPLCFNIFGELRQSPEFADLLSSALGLKITAVEMVECEWLPDDARRIGDRTAFDAFVSFATTKGELGFLAIETKYTETFSQTEYGKDVPNQVYRDVMETSKWFGDDSYDVLCRSATNQLWRNMMLAAHLSGSGVWSPEEAYVVVLRTADDKHADGAISGVQSQLAVGHGSRLIDCSYERLVECARGIPALTDWAERFERRYVDLSPVLRTS